MTGFVGSLWKVWEHIKPLLEHSYNWGYLSCNSCIPMCLFKFCGRIALDHGCFLSSTLLHSKCSFETAYVPFWFIHAEEYTHCQHTWLKLCIKMTTQCKESTNSPSSTGTSAFCLCDHHVFIKSGSFHYHNNNWGQCALKWIINTMFVEVTLNLTIV